MPQGNSAKIRNLENQIEVIQKRLDELESKNAVFGPIKPEDQSLDKARNELTKMLFGKMKDEDAKKKSKRKPTKNSTGTGKTTTKKHK